MSRLPTRGAARPARTLALVASCLLASSCAPPGLALPSERALLGTVRKISRDCPGRYAGSPNEARAARFLEDRLKAAGLEPAISTFPLTCFEGGRAFIECEDGGRFVAMPFIYSPAASTGLLALVALGPEDRLSAARSAILVLGRGSGNAHEIAAEAAAAGVAGIVFVNPHRPTFQRLALLPCLLPMVELGGAEASALLARMAGPESQRARLVVETSMRKGRSLNVAAVLRGKTGRAGAPPLPVIVVGAHLDSAGTPGAGDNASGLACLAELARILASRPPEAEIWFVGFGAEESGQLGSRDFLARWPGPPPDAMFSVDTVGSGATLMAFSVNGAGNAAVSSLVAAGRDLGLRVETGAAEGSDHLAFALAGIPAAFVMRLPEERRHTALDRAEFVEGQALVDTVRLLEAAMGKLAPGKTDGSPQARR